MFRRGNWKTHAPKRGTNVNSLILSCNLKLLCRINLSFLCEFFILFYNYYFQSHANNFFIDGIHFLFHYIILKNSINKFTGIK